MTDASTGAPRRVEPDNSTSATTRGRACNIDRAIYGEYDTDSLTSAAHVNYTVSWAAKSTRTRERPGECRAIGNGVGEVGPVRRQSNR